MKKRLSLLIAAAVIGMSAGPVMAQSYGHGNDDHGHQDKHHDKRHDKYNSHDDHHYSGMHDRGRHEGWYKRGGHVPQEYRGGRYVVTDWRSEHLRAPPRGERWVRSDNGDFLLVAVATGVITDLLLHH